MEVGSIERTFAGDRQALGCPGGQVAGSAVGGVELRSVAHRLLEVVSGELVLLGQGGVRVEPAGELLVQVRAHGLWQRFVRGVPDQEMTEAKRSVGVDLRSLRSDDLLAHEQL